MEDKKEKTTKKNVVITVGREFGSGGREFGRRLASALHIGYYDKELLAEVARRSGVANEFFEKSDERAPGFFNSIFSVALGYLPMSYYTGSSAVSGDSLYRAQSDFIYQLAQEESCVIVGRTADYVLRDTGRTINIFVHAPIDACVARIMAREEGMTAARARARAEKVNRLRANYYNFYTDKVWGAADSYDLTLDTSLLPMDQIVEMVARYAAMRYPDVFPQGE